MHKGVILLVKATDRNEAIEKAEDFLTPFGDSDVWVLFRLFHELII